MIESAAKEEPRKLTLVEGKTDKEDLVGAGAVGVGSYALLSFGSLMFMVAGLYLPQILKLKVAGIELEKSTIDQIATTGSLGIRK